MAAEDQHIKQAKHNWEFWNSFDFNSTSFLDWVVVGIFYEAIHWVDAFFATKTVHALDHKGRSFYMTKTRYFKPIAADFETLKIESENARYGCYKHTPNDILRDLVPKADNIRNHIKGML